MQRITKTEVGHKKGNKIYLRGGQGNPGLYLLQYCKCCSFVDNTLTYTHVRMVSYILDSYLFCHTYLSGRHSIVMTVLL